MALDARQFFGLEMLGTGGEEGTGFGATETKKKKGATGDIDPDSNSVIIDPTDMSKQPKCWGNNGSNMGDILGGVWQNGQWVCPDGYGFPNSDQQNNPENTPNNDNPSSSPRCYNDAGGYVYAKHENGEWKCPSNFPTPAGEYSGGGGSSSGGGGSDAVADAKGQFPQDIAALRENLGRFLQNAFKLSTPKVPGGVTVPEDPNFQKAIDLIMKSMSGGTANLNEAANIAKGVAKTPLPGLSTAQQTAADLQVDGGVPDMTAALAALRTQGLQDIDRYRMDERERFGEMGLSSGSDVAEAVGRGTSQGISDILARQESLIVDLLSRGNQTKLDAARLGGELSTVDADMKLRAAGLLPVIAELERTSSMNAGALIGQIAQNKQGVAERNIERNAAEFIRTSRPYLLEEALSFATNYPPMQQKPTITGGSGGWANIAAAGASGLATILPYLLMGGSALSSRVLKEDIVPADADDVLNRIAEIPLYRWRYKGDTTKHLGPMAEDFRDTFGVGDGKTINLVDVMGVVLATNKALAMKQVGRGKTNA